MATVGSTAMSASESALARYAKRACRAKALRLVALEFEQELLALRAEYRAYDDDEWFNADAWNCNGYLVTYQDDQDDYDDYDDYDACYDTYYWDYDPIYDPICDLMDRW